MSHCREPYNYLSSGPRDCPAASALMSFVEQNHSGSMIHLDSRPFAAPTAIKSSTKQSASCSQRSRICHQRPNLQSRYASRTVQDRCSLNKPPYTHDVHTRISSNFRCLQVSVRKRTIFEITTLQYQIPISGVSI